MANRHELISLSRLVLLCVVLGGSSLPGGGGVFAQEGHLQEPHPKLTITHLTGDVYVYTTWSMLADGPYPSNSAYVVTPAGVLLFDTPWDTAAFQPLLDSIATRHGKKAIFCLATHFHADRTAGLSFYQRQGIPTWTSWRTDSLSIIHAKPRATHHFRPDTAFSVGGYPFTVLFPGEGHTTDNLVLWLEKDKVLIGGCLVKSCETESVGNVEDANLTAWPASIRQLQSRFPHPAFVIPGHLGWQGDPLGHTLGILAKKN